jgi:hypothetical protein
MEELLTSVDAYRLAVEGVREELREVAGHHDDGRKLANERASAETLGVGGGQTE